MFQLNMSVFILVEAFGSKINLQYTLVVLLGITGGVARNYWVLLGITGGVARNYWWCC